ncbi:MAG: ribosome-associated translation inhibitor RaiA [Planctomycetes bacterium]|nr:ribosome-associated translation inhibitor RaiA [Planctomycetota bacterium]
MEITVTGRSIEITAAIKQYATEKVGKLPRYFDRVQLIHVIAGRHDHQNFEVEIIVEAERVDRFVGKSNGPDLYGCIDTVVDKLERQLTDHKERTRHRKGKTSMSG